MKKCSWLKKYKLFFFLQDTCISQKPKCVDSVLLYILINLPQPAPQTTWTNHSLKINLENIDICETHALFVRVFYLWSLALDEPWSKFLGLEKGSLKVKWEEWSRIERYWCALHVSGFLMKIMSLSIDAHVWACVSMWYEISSRGKNFSLPWFLAKEKEPLRAFHLK